MKLYITTIGSDYACSGARAEVNKTIEKACEAVLKHIDGGVEICNADDEGDAVEVKSVLGRIIEKSISLPFTAQDIDESDVFTIVEQELNA